MTCEQDGSDIRSLFGFLEFTAIFLNYRDRQRSAGVLILQRIFIRDAVNTIEKSG